LVFRTDVLLAVKMGAERAGENQAGGNSDQNADEQMARFHDDSPRF
jgi:hypothetical protein